MRLEFEPNVTAFPILENEVFDEIGHPASADFESLLRRGISAAQNGDREHARTLLNEAVEIDPQSEDGWMWLASISDYPEELLAFLNHALEINPGNQRAAEWHAATRTLLAKTFVQRAIAANEQGADELALQCLEQALMHDEDCELAWFWKASIAAREDEKLECLDRVLVINPDNEDARNAVAAIKRSRSQAGFDDARSAAVAGKRDQAIELVDEFLQSVPDNAEAWILRSHLALNLDEKIAFLEKALENDPENAAARSGYDFLIATVGSAMEHDKTADEAVKVEPPQPAVLEAELPEPVMPELAVREAMPEPSMPEPVMQQQSPAPEPIVSEPAMPPVVMHEATPEPESVTHEPVTEPVVAVQEVQEMFATGPTESVMSEPEVEVSPARSVDELFGQVGEFADAENPTVDSLPSFTEVTDPGHDALKIEETSVATDDAGYEVRDHDDSQTEWSLAEAQVDGLPCVFCEAVNETQAFECGSCHAMLTVSDIESLLSNPRANSEAIQHAVTEMEGEWNLREFDENELTALGIGHLNLRNFESGFKYLQEASRLKPNDVIFSGQLNAIAIRLDEIRRQAETDDTAPKGKTILVVDDSPTVRKLISGKLEKSGHSVVCAVDGVEAMEKLGECMPDLVLLDITMPRMDGYEVCRQIRLNPAAELLPVVMISGKDGFFDKVRGRMAGATGYVTKPFGPETLMKALETYLLPDE